MPTSKTMILRIGGVKYLAFILVASFVTELSVKAATISGRVLTSHEYASNPFPAEAQVILYAVSSGNVQGYKEIDRTYTGRDGLFYFRAVPPGRYIIQVEGRNYPVEVTDPNQELGPVKIELNATGVP
jgi:hypothetical protein